MNSNTGKTILFFMVLCGCAGQAHFNEWDGVDEGFEIETAAEDKSGTARLPLSLVCPSGFSHENKGSSGFGIENGKIERGVFKATLKHAAGCGTHTFTACLLNEENSEWGSPGDVITPGEVDGVGEVPVAQVAIQHTTDNTCKAIRSTQVEVDLSRLFRFARSGRNGINSNGIESNFAGKDIWVEVLGGKQEEFLYLKTKVFNTPSRERAFITAAQTGGEIANWFSETDSSPIYIETTNSSSTGPSVSKVRKAFGIEPSLAIKGHNRAISSARLEDLSEDQASWRAIKNFMVLNTGASYRMYKIGPSVDGDGRVLADDRGQYTYLFIGVDLRNPRTLLGFYVRSVET